MKKSKLKAFLTNANDELSIHYSDKLKAIVCCPRKDCSCLSYLRDPDMCFALLSYLVYFEQKSKYEQDSILLQWVIYWFKIPGVCCQVRCREMDGYHVPFDGSCLDDKEGLIEKICTHYFCVRDFQSVMGIGKYWWRMICQVSTSTSIMPWCYRVSKATMKADDPWSAPLKYHLDYMLELGEV